MTEQPVYVVDIFREVVEKVSTNLTAQLQAVHEQITGVHGMPGHHTEIRERLISLSKSSKRFDRYPLIALFQDFKLVRGASGGYYGYVGLQFMILYHTRKEIYTEERTETVFKPILHPIKREFEKQLYAHPNIVFEYEGKRNIEETERPHWGAPAKYGNDGYILDDVLDGIEFFIPRLVLKQIC